MQLPEEANPGPIAGPHYTIQLVVVAGGVYKGQGRKLHELITPCLLRILCTRATIATLYPKHEWDSANYLDLFTK